MFLQNVTKLRVAQSLALGDRGDCHSAVLIASVRSQDTCRLARNNILFLGILSGHCGQLHASRYKWTRSLLWIARRRARCVPSEPQQSKRWTHRIDFYSFLLLGSLPDDRSNRLGMRNIDGMAACRLCHIGACAARHHALRRRRNHAVILCHEIVTGLRAPRRFADRALQCLHTPRNLGIGPPLSAKARGREQGQGGIRRSNKAE